MTQAPTPGPLSGDLAERLRFAETWDLDADQQARDRCGVLMLEAAEALERLAPTAPVEASGSEREAIVERLCVAMQDGVGCTPWENSSWDRDGGVSRELVRESVRRILAALRPQPSGETQEGAGCAEPQVGRAVYERIEKLLTTNPQGWEREYLCHLVESVEEVGGYDGPRLDQRDDRQAVADFLKLRDESVGHSEVDDDERLESADEILALLSARPLALGGQQGERPDFVDAVDQFISDAIENGSVEVMDGSVAWNRPGVVRTLRESLKDCGYEIVATFEALSTTPARAEAQDEGAAGEPTREQWLWAARIVRELGPSMSPGAMAMTMERLAEKAHPSPTPAADDDRVRIAVEEMADAVDFFDRVKASTQAEQIAVGRDHWNRLEAAARAVAALKSEGK